MPVIVSDRCGSCELVNEGTNGYVFDSNNHKKLKDIILSINDSSYQMLIDGVEKFSVNKKDLGQIISYDT